MGRIDIILDDDLEKEFREEVFKGYGLRRGNLTQAIEEAIKMWIDFQRTKRSQAAKKAWEKRKEKHE